MKAFQKEKAALEGGFSFFYPIYSEYQIEQKTGPTIFG